MQSRNKIKPYRKSRKRQSRKLQSKLKVRTSNAGYAAPTSAVGCRLAATFPSRIPGRVISTRESSRSALDALRNANTWRRQKSGFMLIANWIKRKRQPKHGHAARSPRSRKYSWMVRNRKWQISCQDVTTQHRPWLATSPTTRLPNEQPWQP